MVCGDSNAHNARWLCHSHTTDVAGLFCQEFAMAQDLTQIVDLPTRIPDHDDHQPYLLDLFLCSNPDTCTVVSHPPLGQTDHMVVILTIIVPLHVATIISISTIGMWLLKIRNCFVILVITVRESSKGQHLLTKVTSLLGIFHAIRPLMMVSYTTNALQNLVFHPVGNLHQLCQFLKMMSDRSDPGKYRPISLLPNISKIFY